jgi:hypothetical protein
MEIDLGGDWVSTVVAMRAGGYDAEIEVADARLAGSGLGNAGVDTAPALRRLARPFWATYRDDGALLAVHFFKDVTASDRNLLETIASETQLVRPESGGAVWTVLERDGAGSYLALYHRSESQVVKRKLKYMRTDGAVGAPAEGLKVSIDQSELRFSLSPEGGVLALDGTDKVRIGVPLGHSEQLSATVETHLTNLRRSRAPELIGSLATALSEVVSAPLGTYQTDREDARRQLDARLLEGRSTESLLEAATIKNEDQTLADRLAALFRRRAEAIPAALHLLRTRGAQKRITDALAVSRSAAAIAGLGSLARDGALPTSVRTDALTALLLVPHPDAEALNIPLSLLDDGDPLVKSTARLVGGGLARVARSSHPAEAEQIDAALLRRYRKATDVGDVSELLAALGNSIGLSTLPVIQEALGDARQPVRAAAVRALRLVRGADIDALLAAAITSDPDPHVRADAIFAAGFRRPLGAQLGVALLRAARADSVDSVRSHAVGLLCRNQDAAPRITETLAWIAENDTSPGVRRLAQQALPPEPSRVAR